MLHLIHKIVISNSSPYVYTGITKRIKYNEEDTEYILNGKQNYKTCEISKNHMKIVYFSDELQLPLIGGSLANNNVQIDTCFTFDYIYDKIKEFFSNKFDYTFSFKQFLKNNGNEEIVTLQVFKTPISSILKKLTDYVMKDSDIIYDELYHTGLLINGKHIIEKNESISFKEYKKSKKVMNFHSIPLSSSLTIKQLLNNTKTKVDAKSYFTYHALNHNCQMFIKQILTHNHLLSDELLHFFYQDINEIKEKLKDSNLIQNTTLLTDYFAKMKAKIFKGDGIGNIGKGKLKVIKKDIKKIKTLKVIKKEETERISEIKNLFENIDEIYTIE